MTDYTKDPEYLALLATVCERPEDDAPRLILADVIQEMGDDERAEFIRLDVERYRRWPDFSNVCQTEREDRYADHERLKKIEGRLLELIASIRGEYFLEFNQGIHGQIARGFISEIRLTCREFMGGPCERCNRRGVIVTTISAGIFAECETCSGTGYLPGVARELFQAHPIVAVRLTDKLPSMTSINGMNVGIYTWGCGEESFAVPPELFDKFNDPKMRSFGKQCFGEAAALDALSNACVSYARGLVGLHPLPH